MAKDIPMGKRVAEWMQENVHITVYEGGYANKTPEALQKTRDHIDRTCRHCVEAARASGKDV